jgi:hypothetical protein
VFFDISFFLLFESIFYYYPKKMIFENSEEEEEVREEGEEGEEEEELKKNRYIVFQFDSRNLCVEEFRTFYVCKKEAIEIIDFMQKLDVYKHSNLKKDGMRFYYAFGDAKACLSRCFSIPSWTTFTSSFYKETNHPPTLGNLFPSTHDASPKSTYEARKFIFDSFEMPLFKAKPCPGEFSVGRFIYENYLYRGAKTPPALEDILLPFNNHAHELVNRHGKLR